MTSNAKPDLKDGTTTSTTRKNRPLRRKTSHSVIERRRREKINEGLINLQNLVPACRDELRELLLSKANSNKRNQKRSKHDIEKEVDDLLEEKIKSSMVLEKLCIISHTVDYVRELQASMAAYRELCRCSPPLSGLQAVQDHSQSKNEHSQVHLIAKTARDGSEDNKGQDTESSPEKVGENCAKCCLSRAKRRRHWGSNNPLGLAKPNNAKSISLEIQSENDSIFTSALVQRPKRKAAPALHSMREESITMPEEESSQEELHECNHEQDHVYEDDSSDNTSDLELDDWNERQFAPSQLPISPSLSSNSSTSSQRSDTYDTSHTVQLQNPQKKEDQRKQDYHSIRSSIGGLEQQAAMSTPLPVSRKRRATETMPLNYGDVQTKSISKRSKPTKVEGDVLEVSPVGLSKVNTACKDCVEDGKYSLGNLIGPQNRFHKERAESPSDRMLHKRINASDGDKLSLLADIVAQR